MLKSVGWSITAKAMRVLTIEFLVLFLSSMKKFLSFLSFIGRPFARLFQVSTDSCQAAGTVPKSKVVTLQINSDSLTEAELSRAVAGAFVGVPRPEYSDPICTIVSSSDAECVTRLVFGEKPNSFGLFIDRWPVALIQLSPGDIVCLERYYKHELGKPLNTLTLGLTPVQTWLPMVT